MPVGLLRGQRAVGIDGDDACALPSGLGNARPEVQVRGDRIGAPEHDQLRIAKMFDVGADLGTDHGVVAGPACARTQHTLGERRPQPVEETPRQPEVVDEAERARIGVGQDRLRIVAGDLGQAPGDGVQRFIPADANELATPGAFLADPFHRVEQAVRVVGALQIARDLGAQNAGRTRMIRIPAHAGGDALLDCDEHGAGVRTIMRTSPVDHGLSGMWHYAAPSTVRVSATRVETKR